MNAKYHGEDLFAVSWAERTFGPAENMASYIHTRNHLIDAFRAGWERHEGSQKAEPALDEVAVIRQQEILAVGILRALNIAPNDPAIDAIIYVMNSAQPAPIVSHPQYDVKQAADKYATAHNFVAVQIADTGASLTKIYEAFIAGADWQRGRQHMADQPEIGAPISEMPLTGLVLDKLNRVIEMLQRQNNRTDEFAQGVEADFRKVMARVDQIEENTCILCSQIETDDKWFDGLSAKADEILGLMRPAEKEPNDNPLHDFFVTLTAALDATGIDVETLLTPAGQNDYARWQVIQKQGDAIKAERREVSEGISEVWSADIARRAKDSMVTDESGYSAGFMPSVSDEMVKDVINQQREEITGLQADVDAARLEIKRMYDREDAIAERFRSLHDVLSLGRPA